MFTAKGQRNIIIVLLTIIIGVLLFPEVVRKAVLVVVTATDGTEAQETDNQRRAPEPTIVKRENLASASA